LWSTSAMLSVSIGHFLFWNMQICAFFQTCTKFLDAKFSCAHLWRQRWWRCVRNGTVKRNRSVSFARMVSDSDRRSNGRLQCVNVCGCRIASTARRRRLSICRTVAMSDTR
jgi:hypothetical protein